MISFTMLEYVLGSYSKGNYSISCSISGPDLVPRDSQRNAEPRCKNGDVEKYMQLLVCVRTICISPSLSPLPRYICADM